MHKKHVIVTVEPKRANQLEEILAGLRLKGLDVEKMDTVLNVTQIEGNFEGDLKNLRSDGVSVEADSWKTEM
jgi:hypothetical protein